MDTVKRDVWALKLTDDKWYPCDHHILDDRVMRDSRNARPFFGDDGKFYAKLFGKSREGSMVVPHPHPEMFR